MRRRDGRTEVRIEATRKRARSRGKENVVTSGRTRDVDGLRFLLNVLERSLDTTAEGGIEEKEKQDQ